MPDGVDVVRVRIYLGKNLKRDGYRAWTTAGVNFQNANLDGANLSFARSQMQLYRILVALGQTLIRRLQWGYQHSGRFF